MYIRYNRNRDGLEVGDCVIRAISTVLDLSWDIVHDDICYLSGIMADMPSSNRVWKKYLRNYGFVETMIDTDCPNCLTVQDFCERHPIGRYILSTCEYTAANQIVVAGTHVLAVIYGDYYDIFDSGSDIPLSYFYIN